MNLFEIAALKDRVLKYLSENIKPCVSIAIYTELKLENLPYVVFNEYLKEMDRDDVLHINEMSGNRNLLFITDKGRRLLFDGGYVKTTLSMTKKQKLQRIVEFLSTENDRSRKSGFDSEEIAKAFTPELNIYEVNTLCKILLANGDVKDCTTKDESAKRMVAVLVINATHDAYHTNKYLEEGEELSMPINQNIISGHNIIVGNTSGDIKQGDNSAITAKSEEKMNWLKWVYWIVGILVGLTVLIAFIKSIL
jgi:predicted transcriptional regulator